MQGIAKELSISEDITSPTFALSHHYNSGKIPLIHLDLYRLENSSMAKEFYLAEEEEANQTQAILVIEWPELIKNMGEDKLLEINGIVERYVYLHRQKKNSWTFELDIRNSKERW